MAKPATITHSNRLGPTIVKGILRQAGSSTMFTRECPQTSAGSKVAAASVTKAMAPYIHFLCPLFIDPAGAPDRVAARGAARGG